MEATVSSSVVHRRITHLALFRRLVYPILVRRRREKIQFRRSRPNPLGSGSRCGRRRVPIPAMPTTDSDGCPTPIPTDATAHPTEVGTALVTGPDIYRLHHQGAVATTRNPSSRLAGPTRRRHLRSLRESIAPPTHPQPFTQEHSHPAPIPHPTPLRVFAIPGVSVRLRSESTFAFGRNTHCGQVLSSIRPVGAACRV